MGVLHPPPPNDVKGKKVLILFCTQSCVIYRKDMRDGVYVVQVMHDCKSPRTHVEVLSIFIVICEPGLFLNKV